jgi:HD-like signal output (HDOD) protein
MHMNKSLVEFVTDYLSSNTLELPVFHSVSLKLQQMLAKGNYSINEVMEVISEDQALASKILRVANSPFYSGLSKVSTIRDAIVRLGAQEVANLTMMASQQDFYRSDNDLLNRNMHILWNHALGCAIGTKWLATKVGYKDLAQEAFLAGLLHDIGKLFLLKVLDELAGTAQLSISLSGALIQEVLDSLHTQQGHLLMQKWNLPEIYCQIVLNHHQEEYGFDDIPTTLVRLTNLACRKAGAGMHREPSLVLLTTREAQFLGIKEIVLAELEITIEDSIGTVH